MANVNKVLFIGRLTRDPKIRAFQNGGKVAAFGFAVSNRKKNMQTGQWEDEPMFIDVKVFNRGENGRQADLAEQSLRKGHQVFLEGHLVLETWEDKNGGGKRSKHVLVIDNFQFLERCEDGMGDGGSRPAPARRPAAQPARQTAPAHDDFDEPHHSGGGGTEEEIPF
ncbi:MAG: single-stranded DNA-binding protein [Gemmataceae bacterium]|nr:single-stranded DNA-binding protein [Gemmataceae bacterium]